MSRIRTIKPEFCQSESIGKLSRDARLLFILLWTVADDSGRARASSRMLASTLFPFDEDSSKPLRELVEDWLLELEQNGFILRYKVDGASYLEIDNWLKHQKIDRPTPSRIPGPLDEESSNSRRALDEPSTNPRRALAAESSLPGPVPRTGSRVYAREAREPDDPPKNFKSIQGKETPNGQQIVDAERSGLASRDAIMAEWQSFLDYNLAKGTVIADFDAAWRGWLRKVGKFSSPGRSNGYGNGGGNGLVNGEYIPRRGPGLPPDDGQPAPELTEAQRAERRMMLQKLSADIAATNKTSR